LSPKMTLEEFDHGYWYATELKAFAHTIGIRGASAMRKDQLEKALRTVLSGKHAALVVVSTRGAKNVVRDTARPLTMRRRIVQYTNDRTTKDFLQREARKLAPHVRFRSGARYRLNRWR